jgi:predicted Zn finger-like uncharacterized protein
MKIQCPRCNASGRIDDSKIPEKSVYIRCPKCNERFYLERGIKPELEQPQNSKFSASNPDSPKNKQIETPEKKHNVALEQNYQKDGKRYEEYSAQSRSAAIAFLCDKEVKDQAYYISVATPDGWYGRDLLEIYDENTQKRIKLPQRHPMPNPVKSMTRCTRCGYTVLPITRHTFPNISGPAEIVITEEKYDFKENGLGYVCPDCRTLWCAHCTGTSGRKATCAICGKGIEPFVEWT